MNTVGKLLQRQMLLLLILGVFIPELLCAEDDAPAVESVPNPRVQLLTMDFPGTHWDFFSGKKDSALGETWTVKTDSEPKQTTLICKGEPYGYIRTKKEYRNYSFGLEWKFPKDANGNSGILLHVTGEDRIWPKALQVQLHQPFAGSTFPGGGAKTANELRNVPMLSKPVDHWNSCLITSLNGVVTVTVNGELVGEVKGCDPLEGKIALQSEGAEVHFRNVWIEELPLKDVEKPPAKIPVMEETKSTRIWYWFQPGGQLERVCTSHIEFSHRAIRKPLVIKTQSQRARGERRLKAEWVQLQTTVCD